MSYYIDMHDHLLPGVDDGSQTMEETLDLIEIEYQQGVRKIIFTPHYMLHKNSYTYEELDKKLEEVRTRVAAVHPDMEFYLGNEILYENGIEADLRAGNLIHTMAGSRYVLVEFNIKISWQEFYNAMKTVTELRYRPIIAHVERYRCITGHEDRVRELRRLGVYLQMNAESLDGGFFDEEVRWCRRLVKDGYIDFISSDAHDMETRTPDMGDAIKWVTKKCGEDMVDALFRENAEMVIANKYIDI